MKRLLSLIGLVIMSSACGSSVAPTSFAAQYRLEGVTPDWFVPVGGSNQKNISTGCMDFKPGGVLVRTIVYTQTPTGGLGYFVTEVDTWSYSISGSEIAIIDPAFNSSVPETIATTSDMSFQIYTILRNAGISAARTLQFRKESCALPS